jgi:hypothetical protein
MLLLSVSNPPRNGELFRDDFWTKLSFRSTDFSSDPELGSFMFTSLFFYYGLLLEFENILPVIENLWPMLLDDDFSPPMPKLLRELPGSWPRLKLYLYWNTFSVLFLPRPKLPWPNHDSLRCSYPAGTWIVKDGLSLSLLIAYWGLAARALEISFKKVFFGFLFLKFIASGLSSSSLLLA